LSFVPWESVILLETKTGCMGAGIQIYSTFEDDTKPIAAPAGASLKQDAEVKKASDKKHKSEEKKSAFDSAHVQVHIPVKPDHIDEIFKIIQKLALKGQEPKPLKDTAELFYMTELFDKGLIVTVKTKKTFLCWEKAESLEFNTGLIGKGTATFTDYMGHEVSILKVDADDYQKLRDIWLTQRGQVVHGSAPIIKRKNLRISADGVTFIRKTGMCSSAQEFFPWTFVDAAEQHVSLLTSRLDLITESGDKVTVWSGYFWQKKQMNETLSKLNEMKYGTRSDKETHRKEFGGGFMKTPCVLTDSFLQVSASTGCCSTVMMVLDLDSVEDVKVVGPVGRPTHLQVSIKMEIGEAAKIDDALAKKMGTKCTQKDLMVALAAGDKAHAKELVADISKRSHERKRQEGSAYAFSKKAVDQGTVEQNDFQKAQAKVPLKIPAGAPPKRALV